MDRPPQAEIVTIPDSKLLQYFIKLDGDSWINLENFPEIQGAGRGGPVLVGGAQFLGSSWKWILFTLLCFATSGVHFKQLLFMIHTSMIRAPHNHQTPRFDRLN